MTPVTPTASPAIEMFRRLMLVALAAGTLAGVVWFAIQSAAVVPLIEQAETNETPDHPDTSWRPRDGSERTLYTLAATVFSGIGFSAILFGWVAFTGLEIDMRRGALLGLAGFACFHLAPALGLPPEPPGVPVADVTHRQLWWAVAAASTALGLWLLSRRNIIGALALALPHAIGAPKAIGEGVVPAELIRNFAIASLGAALVFWIVLGAAGGYLFNRYVNSR